MAILIRGIILFVVLLVLDLSGQQITQDNFENISGNSSFQREIWDVQFSSNIANGYGAEFDGSFFYVTSTLSNLIYKYDSSGNLITTFSIPGISGLKEISYDGTFMYGGTGSSTIYQMDFVSQTLIGNISSPFDVRHIAYDEINDAFWIGSWSGALALISRTGTVMNIFSFPLTTVSGIAYDNVSSGGPYLWFFDRGGVSPGPQLILQFHIASGTFTGINHNVLSDVGTGQLDAIAGGLFSTQELITGTFSLGGILIGNPSILFVYELVNPIPVELVSFTASHFDGKIILDWETASEVNNKGFEIEKKQKFINTDWVKIGFIPGKGTTSNTNDYTFFYEEKKTGIYLFRLKQIDLDGSCEYSEVVELMVNVTEEFSLSQNYPNPFNPSTKIKFTIPSVETTRRVVFTTLKVYDILGNEVSTLVNEELAAGEYEVEFNIHSDGGQNLSSGIYFYQLKIGGPETSLGQAMIQSRKMVYLK